MKKIITPKSNIYFSSDFHYHHGGIVKGTSSWEDTSRCRDFETLEEHDNTLVDNINNTIGEDDILFFLGDWSFGNYKSGDNYKKVKEFRDRLKVKEIHLILGNHDEEIVKHKELQELFTSVNHYLELTVVEPSDISNTKAFKQKIIMMHYALRVWNNSAQGAICLFGHCLDNATEILTDRGWLFFKDLKITDQCLSYDTETSTAVYSPIKKLHSFLYTGKMYSLKGRTVNFRATSKHRHLLKIPYSNNYEYILSEDFKFQQRNFLNSAKVFHQGLELSDLYLRLYVQINADGSFENKSLVRFHLKKERKILRLCALLKELNIKYSLNKNEKSGSTKINFRLPIELSTYRFKPLDSQLINMSSHQVSLFFEEYIHTDGYMTSVNSLQIYSSREAEIDLIQQICVENGIRCNKLKRIRNLYTGWIVSINFNRNTSHINFKEQDLNVENVNSEEVWCITTPLSNFLIRREGKTHFTGNSHGSLNEYTPTFSNPTWIGDGYFIKNYKTMDVGIDCHPEFRPFSYQEIKTIMQKKDVILNVDHH